MTGLRARQKADRNQRIVEAATQLFREDGYAGTKLETIATLAEVSVGTVYNYYENKGDLLVAIVSKEVNEVLAAGARLISEPPADIAQTIDDLMFIYLDHSLVYLNKDMWREAMANTTRRPETHYGRAYIGLDHRLMAQTCDLIAGLQRDGLVRTDVDTQSVGEMLFNNLNMMFTVFVRSDTMPLEALKADISRQNRPLAMAISR